MKRYIIALALLAILAGCGGTSIRIPDGGIGGTGQHVSQDVH